MSNNIQVNFESQTKKVKPMHGVCNAPYSTFTGANQPLIDKYLKEGNIPYCRLHDTYGEWGSYHFVDVPCVFPNFDADENDPTNYDFHYTDEYIAAIQKTGCEAYYRLGVTIEWGSKKYMSVPPKDFNKWARICEHIIMHYNYGWADGFEYDIKYWEIWNEPENPGNINGKCMWSGTKEEFFDLYRITATHLKQKFPNIKVGGYGSCGFYAVTDEKASDITKGFVTYFTDFLDMLNQTETPLDFYSWHIYSANVNEVVAHGKFARETLDKYGFNSTEVHLNEWNFGTEATSFDAKHKAEGMAFNTSVLCALASTDYVDSAMYYCFSSGTRYNGLINQNTDETDLPWYSFVAYGQLYKMGRAVECKVDGKDYYAFAARDDEHFGILAVNYKNDDSDFSFDISGCEADKTVKVKYIKDGYPMIDTISFTSSKKMCITLTLKKHETVFIVIE
ncbi:MAG: hypothetical protein U0L11_10835 [Acutalibacteraceae bacterium]|nr:hypothetical protein [Acutalibacteraceae bacterium]